MRSSSRFARSLIVLTCIAALVIGCTPGFASAYNGHPKLVVVIVIDQFRGDYLERYRDQFGDAGFRLFLEHEAYTVCRSAGSTTICGSNCPVERGRTIFELCHEAPLLSLIISAIVGALQMAQSGTAPYCG